MEQHWDFWAWLAYGCIWVAAIIQATDLGVRMAPEIRKKLERLVSAKIWGVGPLVLLSLSGLIFIGQALVPRLSRGEGSAHMQPLPIEFRIGGDPVKFNYYFQNTGTLPAIGMVHNEAIAITDKEQTDEEIDNGFALLKTSLKPLEKQKADSEIQVGERNWFTFKYSISQEQYKSVTDGDKYLYLLALVEYRDSNTPTEKWRVTEMCNFTMRGQGLHTCAHHNRIGTSD
jgi:hypothetical protein